MRKGPEESATKFKVGTKMIGNDGNYWIIKKNKNGIQRWVRENKTIKRTRKNTLRKKNTKQKSNSLTLQKIKALKKKYSVSVNGSKGEIINGLWRVAGSWMSNKDLEMILPFLQKDYKKQAEKKLQVRKDRPITDYKGMWKPLPKPLNKMKRNELIKHLQYFRDIWEKTTRRNQDLDDDRLNIETDEMLRSLLEFYFSDDAKQIAEDFLR